MLKEAVQKGAFIKHCPCSPGAVPCGYFNLNLHTGCPFACNYCILQTYLEDKSQAVFYTNWKDLKVELQKFLAVNKEVRIGTGELSDSLAYESLLRLRPDSWSCSARFPNAVFEFKTKATHVHALLAMKEIPKNIVVSWSLNPPQLIRSEELLTPTLAKRLRALAAVQDKGYKIGVHFDPLILFPNWQKHYRELIRRLATGHPTGAPRLVEPGRPALSPGLEKTYLPPSQLPAILGGTDPRPGRQIPLF